MPSVAVIGELNLDLIVTGAPGLPEPGVEKIVQSMDLTLGSSSAIIAAQFARLGDDILFVSKVGGDDFGRRCLEFLRDIGVPTDAVEVLPEMRSGLTISIAAEGERAMLTQLGCIEEMRWGDVDFGLLRGRRHLHISSFYLQRNLRPDIARIFQKAHELGLTTSLDTGFPSDEDSDGNLAAVWPHVDVFLPNEIEAQLLTGSSTVEEALPKLSALVPTAVVKLGGEGALVCHGEEVIRHPTFAVNVVETTGAGDSFNGGFLHGYLSGWDLGDSLDLGLACGALSTRAAGGTTTQARLEEACEFIRTAPRRRV